MSSACTTVSPSQLSTGPGGCATESARAANAARVSAGVPAVSAAMSREAITSNRNPAPAIFRKKPGGVVRAVAVMCARVSRTVRPGQSEAVAHCSAVNRPASASSARRSAWTSGQGSRVVAMPPS
ncbi:hypothetical protein GCM10025734_32130 [Kitasatospora paranensis]